MLKYLNHTSVSASLNRLGLGVSFAADITESVSTSDILTAEFSERAATDTGEKRRPAPPASCFNWASRVSGFGRFTAAKGVKQLGGRGLLGETTFRDEQSLIFTSSVLGSYSRMSVRSGEVEATKRRLLVAKRQEESSRGLVTSIDTGIHLRRNTACRERMKETCWCLTCWEIVHSNRWPQQNLGG